MQHQDFNVTLDTDILRLEDDHPILSSVEFSSKYCKDFNDFKKLEEIMEKNAFIWV